MESVTRTVILFSCCQLDSSIKLLGPSSQFDVFSLQLLLERKNNEVGKLIEETQKSMSDLAENINQAKVNFHLWTKGFKETWLADLNSSI